MATLFSNCCSGDRQLAVVAGFTSAQADADASPTIVRGDGHVTATCTQNPNLSEALLREGQRLGVKVIAGPPELPGKDASYRAEHGRLGTIRLKQRPMSAEVRCLLISHEFIHVLQHLRGQLKGVPPLGWGPSRDQEAEAYAHQNQAGYVLQLLRKTPGPSR